MAEKNETAILSLLHSLTDSSVSNQHVLINKYLQQKIGARIIFLAFISTRENTLLIYALGSKKLTARVKIPLETPCFTKALHNNQIIKTSDLSPEQQKDLYKVLEILQDPQKAMDSRKNSEKSGTEEGDLGAAFSPRGMLSPSVSLDSPQSREDAAPRNQSSDTSSRSSVSTPDVFASIDQSAILAKLQTLNSPESFLCVPLMDKRKANRNDIKVKCGNQSDIAILVCCVNKFKKQNEKIEEISNSEKVDFTESDISCIQEVFQFVLPLCLNSIDYEHEIKLSEDKDRMLEVTQRLFAKLNDVPSLLQEIMSEAKTVTNAERCSLFLVDRQREKLVAQVFDGQGKKGVNKSLNISQGIAGQVATTGVMLNIPDVYSHPLFYRGLDEETGFVTKAMLVFPIFKNENSKTAEDVIGVAELCNKLTSHVFTQNDEIYARSFGVFCGIALAHSILYDEIKTAQSRIQLANELVILHMGVNDEDIAKLSTAEIPNPTHLHEDFMKFSYFPRSLTDDKTPLAVISMMNDLGLISEFYMNPSTLSKFVLMVRKGYRSPPYHNWIHAYSVTHFAFLLIKNLALIEKKILNHELALVLLASCLCHDLDHRGTTNSFQASSNSVLASLYSSDGSVMERHHFAQAICILNTEGCNIFESLSSEKYKKCLDDMKDLILATDLSHHINLVEKMEAMATSGFDKNNSEHIQLFTYLVMTAADLSDQTKDFGNTKDVAKLIYKEFFSQGDLEKAMGSAPIKMMDRDTARIPELQLNFLNSIAIPVYKLIANIFPSAKDPYNSILESRKLWQKVHDGLKERGNYPRSMLFFDEDLSEFI